MNKLKCIAILVKSIRIKRTFCTFCASCRSKPFFFRKHVRKCKSIEICLSYYYTTILRLQYDEKPCKTMTHNGNWWTFLKAILIQTMKPRCLILLIFTNIGTRVVKKYVLTKYDWYAFETRPLFSMTIESQNPGKKSVSIREKQSMRLWDSTFMGENVSSYTFNFRVA